MANSCLSKCATPNKIAVCESWPQACMLPWVCELKSTPLSSMMGKASMSARMPMVGPSPVPMLPTTPVMPTLVRTSMPPISRRVSATSAAVRTSWKANSGCAWISRRKRDISSWSNLARSSIDMSVLFLFIEKTYLARYLRTVSAKIAAPIGKQRSSISNTGVWCGRILSPTAAPSIIMAPGALACI